MDATKSSSLSSFKSKKPFRFNSKKGEIENPVCSPEKEARNVSAPSPTPWDVKTPGKASNPPRRTRHRSAAMSIKEVRQAAMMLRERGSAQPSENDLELDTGKERVVKPKKKSGDSETTLPEKYELLDKFFNSLDSSIRLLQLKRSATTFTNISPQIERLTDRRFTHGHLAQLKFIMPEAIVLEKVLRHDESTSCMKPDLRITLNVEAIDSQNKSKSSSRNLQLRKVFRDRLMEFFKSHPEGDEVPEEALPEPFSQLKKDPNSNLVPSLTSESTDVAMPGKTVKASHLSLSFKRSFSQRGSTLHLENTKQGQSSKASLPETPVKCINPTEDSGQILVATTPVSKSSVDLLSICFSTKAPSGSTPPSPLPETPVKCTNPTEEKDQSSVILKTPIDHASTPVKLMSATPALRPPKRCYMSPEDNSARLPNKLARRPANRPLTFGSPVKSLTDDEKFGKTKISTTDDDIYDILPDCLLQSIQEKERFIQIENDPAISQAKWRKQMIANLPKLFDMIYFLFQSIRRSVVTKEELIQKIITGHLDIIDRKEVEEQLRLLQEFIPEWISEKSGLSGDNLICVKKISCPEMIRSRLLAAK